MGTASGRHGGETAQAVGDDFGAGRERSAGQFLERLLAEGFYAPQDDLMRFTVGRRLDRGDKGRLAFGSPPWRTGTLAAEIGVVHFYSALQALLRVAL